MLHLELQPEVEAQLTAEASALDVKRFIEEQLTNKLRPAKTQTDHDETAAAIRKLRGGNILGDDLTIKELINEGRKY